MPDQKRYYPNQVLYIKNEKGECVKQLKEDWKAKRTWPEGDYISDLCMNTSWNPMVAAGGKLTQNDVGRIVACPKDLPLKTILRVEWYGDLKCYDRWGAIRWNRLDLRTGVGDEWLNNILNNKIPGGRHYVYVVTE